MVPRAIIAATPVFVNYIRDPRMNASGESTANKVALSQVDCFRITTPNHIPTGLNGNPAISIRDGSNKRENGISVPGEDIDPVA
ncbi:MAG TPA: hypothetical protein PLU64_03150, partial [Saprospiraceae bacterium]|nr:hypothetical protein [Saprospiraceae bacterium]